MVTRRGFIASAGAGLTLAILPRTRAANGASDGLTHPFLRIGVDDTVTVIAKHLDMGQGIWTGLASIVAEELDAAWSQVRVVGAPADKAVYKNLIFGNQTTGGSTSIANSWEQLRKAGATARAMLVEAAASRWNVASQEIVVAEGILRHSSGRSATFGQLAEAAATIPVPSPVKLKGSGQFKFLGKAFPRLDSKEKSSGKTVFGVDIQRPGQKVALVSRAPRFGATVLSFDASGARKIKGVADVVQIPSGIAVVAGDTWTAKRARAALKIEWDYSKAETRSTDAMMSDFKAQATTGERIACIKRGNPVEAFGRAARVVEADFEIPYLAHAQMEPLSAVCAFSGNRCEIWGGIQNQTADQAAVAKILGLDLENVILNTLYAGGSFGRRATFNSDWISELAHIAKATAGRYPVKVMWTREDDITGGYYRPMSFQRIRAGMASDGKIVALEQTIVVQSFLFGPPKPGVPGRPDPTAVDGNIADRYDIADATLDWINPPSGVPVHMFRALSFNHTTFTKEVFIDELARAAGRDPIEFRLAHLTSKPRQMAVLKLAADKAGWGRTLEPGVAMGIAVQESQNSFVAQIAEVRIVDHTIRVNRVVCAVDCGFVLNPDIVVAQVEGGIAFGLSAALFGNITFKDGIVDQSNFHDYPVLRLADMPKVVEVHILNSGNAPTGVGEPCMVPIAPAVANAVASLTGKPVRKMPFTVS